MNIFIDNKNGAPIYDQIYTQIKEQIINGTLQEGDQMLPEIQICEAMDLSRSTVRKTMDKLIEDAIARIEKYEL